MGDIVKKKKREGLVFFLFGGCIIALTLFVLYNVSMKEKVNQEENMHWDIHFVDLIASAVGKADYTLPTFSNTVVQQHTVTINEVGDSVTFQFRVVNNGNQDAHLKDIVMSIPRCKGDKVEDEKLVCDNLIYKLCNEDGTELKDDIVLSKESSMVIHLLVEYPSSMKEKPKKSVVIDNLDIDLIFSKK